MRHPARLDGATRGQLRSIVSRGAGVGELFGGKSLSQEWNDWIAAERDEALRLRDRLRTDPPGLAETTRVCDVAHYTAFPRVSPDGSRIAFIATDEGRQPLGLYVADLHACDPRRIARVDSSHAFAWSPDGRSIVLSQLALWTTRARSPTCTASRSHPARSRASRDRRVLRHRTFTRTAGRSWPCSTTTIEAGW